MGAAILVFGHSGPCFAQERATTLTADEVMRRAVERNQRLDHPWNHELYTYTKVSITEELDSSGKITERKAKTWQVLFKDGETHAKLVDVNGKPPRKADLKNNSDNESTARRLMGQPGPGKGDNREMLLQPTIVSRFEFHLAGQEQVHGRMAYRLTFEPKSPGAPVHHMVDRLLDRLSGTLWIDAQEFELAKASMRLRSEVDLLGGILGSLKKLAYTVDRTRVAEGVWLNTFSSGDFEGRKLLDSMRIRTKSQSLNFKPAIS